jgi:hypothetical protein
LIDTSGKLIPKGSFLRRSVRSELIMPSPVLHTLRKTS